MGAAHHVTGQFNHQQAPFLLATGKRYGFFSQRLLLAQYANSVFTAPVINGCTIRSIHAELFCQFVKNHFALAAFRGTVQLLKSHTLGIDLPNCMGYTIVIRTSSIPIPLRTL